MERCQIARDIMVTGLFTLHPQTYVFDGIAFLLRHDVSGVPVVDEDRNYLGVFSEKCGMNVLTVSARLAEETKSQKLPALPAKDFMVTRLVTLSPRMDVFEAIGLLLKHRISGAPVVDEQRRFLGVLSERYIMQVLIAAAYDQLPTSEVSAFMNTDQGRIIDEHQTVLELAKIFLETPYRRLVVVKDGKLLGQISRRDVLRAKHPWSEVLRDRERLLLNQGEPIQTSELPTEPAPERLPTPEVSAYMDRQALTISEELDLLSIAQIFLQTNYRRLPVLREGKLVGQVSRRDVLRATHDLIQVAPIREAALLYLSALVERNESPIE